jgi:hypothetical protein
VQSSNSVLTSSNEKGDATLSVLQDMQSQGAIILHTFCEDGTVRSQTLTRLPTELTDNVEVAILPQREEDDESSNVVRIILNQSPREGYVIGETRRYALPAIIEREKSTIPVVQGTAQLRLDGSTSIDVDGILPRPRGGLKIGSHLH